VARKLRIVTKTPLNQTCFSLKLLQITRTDKMTSARGKLPCKLAHKTTIAGIDNQYFFQNFSLKTANIKKDKSSQETTFGDTVKKGNKADIPIRKRTVLSLVCPETVINTANKNIDEKRTERPVRPVRG